MKGNGVNSAQAQRIGVFLDRDGVINRPVVRAGKPYPPSALEQFAIYPDAPAACALLKAAGLAASGSEATRKINERAVRVDGALVEDASLLFAAGGEHLLQLGKRGYARVRLIAA